MTTCQSQGINKWDTNRAYLLLSCMMSQCLRSIAQQTANQNQYIVLLTVMILSRQHASLLFIWLTYFVQKTPKFRVLQLHLSGIDQDDFYSHKFYLNTNKMDNIQLHEGFEEAEYEHLSSKNKEKIQETQLYFHIPQAKPLLSKIPIDHQKPKILIRDIKIDIEYQELLKASAQHYIPLSQKIVKKQQSFNHTTLWQRYIVSKNYRCLYLKFHSQRLLENERKGKKLRNIIQKIAMGNQWLLATYIIQMTFLSENTSILLRNLTAGRLVEQLHACQDEEIQFDSCFQNGNLMYVFQELQSSSRQFHLVLQNDINTKGYANWFFFKINSMKEGPIRLHIVNLQKNFSYFGQGMKLAVYSLRQNKGWRMLGSNISYYKNQILKCRQNNEKYNTLSFTIDQKHSNDILIIAASPPYTYSRLLQFLRSLEEQTKSLYNLYFRRETLCSTISRNDCPLITLTWKRDRKQEKSKKKIIVVIARQHPSQTVSSWVVEGVIQKLTRESIQVQELLRKYIFKIVPMANIDGVIYGNSRCDISGSDCNRKWTKNSNQVIYPTVTAIRKLVTELVYQGYEIEYFFDLHGHSRKLGSFIYGCKSFDEIQSRIFSWILSKITDKFVFEQCRFGVSPFRRDTARGFMGSILTNKKSMTLQTSLYGYKNNDGELVPFNTQQLKNLGESLVTAIHSDTFRTNNHSINWANIRNDIKIAMTNKAKEDSSEGSDSDPEGQQLTQKQKAATFLSPSLASKIGLVEVKVFEKLRKNSKQAAQYTQQRNYDSFQPIVGKEGAKLINSSIKRLSISKSLTRNEFMYPSNLRESKSVTKVESFRLRSLDKKEKKKIRIAIQVQRQPRIPVTLLPQVKTRNSIEFWQELKSEYQSLVSQKKTLIQSAKSHQLSRN